MATFNDLKRVLEDTLRVDMKNRWTPQAVKFINNKNEFYGKFFGLINSTKLSADEAHLLSAFVQHLVVGDNGVDISKFADYIYDLQQKTDDLSIDYETLANLLLELSVSVNELDQQSSQQLSVLEEKINEERTNRTSEDELIRKDLNDNVSTLQEKDSEIIQDFVNYKEVQKQKQEKTIKELKEYSDNNKHFDIEEIESIGEYYQLKDFTSNKINDVVPDFFVTTDKRKIGYITNLTRDSSGGFYSFTLNILLDAYKYYPTLGSENHQYNFSKATGVTEHKTGVGNFAIKWDVQENDNEQLHFMLQSEPARYFEVKNNDDVVAKIDSHIINEDKTGLDYCNVTFNKKLDERLDGEKVIFDGNDRYIYNKEKDYSVTYDGKENFRVVLDVSKGIPYHKLANETDKIEFARILSADTKYDVDGSITEIKVSNLSGNEYVLNLANDFTCQIKDSDKQFVFFKDNKIIVENVEKYYKFALSGYNSTTGTELQTSVGFINLSTVNACKPEQEKIGFSLEINDEKNPEFNGVYSLTPVYDVESPTGYSENEFRGFNESKTIILKYNKKYSPALITIIKKAEMKTIGHFYVDLQNVVIDDQSTIINKSGDILTDGVVKYDSLDETYLTISNISFDINNEKVDAQPSIQQIDSIPDSSIIQIMLPQKINGKARTFDVLIEPNTYQDGKFTEIKLLPPSDDINEAYKFYYNGRDVTNKFYINKARNAFRFIELDNSALNIEFQIVDLNNTEILDRECVSFMGELFALEDDNHLTCYFTQKNEKLDNNVIKHGWLYRVADNTGVMFDNNGLSVALCRNDQVMFKNTVAMKDVAISDFVITRDAQKEVEELYSYVKNNYVKLSGNNFISGDNTISSVNLCVEHVVDSNINTLTVENEYVTSNLSANNVIVDSNNLKFSDVSSSFNKICSDINVKIDQNKQNIESLSNSLFVNEDQFGHKGLSGKVDFLLNTGIDSFEFKGDLKDYDCLQHKHELKRFIAQNDEGRYGEFLKKGVLFRIDCNTPELSDDQNNTIQLNINDYIFTKEECVLSDVTIDKLAIIRDAQEEAKELQKWVNTNFLHLSGGDFVDGLETFNTISVSNATIDDCKMSNLQVDKSTIVNGTINNLSANNSIITNISVDSNNLYFSDVSKTANEICSDIQSQITSNDSDIETLSNDVYKTIVNPNVIEYDTSKVPNCLILKDTEEENSFYKLTITNGVLTVNKI